MEKSRLCNFLEEFECYLPWQFTNSRATEKEIKKLNFVRLRKISGNSFVLKSYSGSVPRRLKPVKTTSTRWPGPARKMYRHCLEIFVGLSSEGAVKVPFCGPPARDTNV